MPPAEMFKYTQSTANAESYLMLPEVTGTRGAAVQIFDYHMPFGNGIYKTYVVPTGCSSLEIYCFGGGNALGGFSFGTLAVSAGQKLAVITGSGSRPTTQYPCHAEAAAYYSSGSYISNNQLRTDGKFFGFGISSTSLAGVFREFPVTSTNATIQSSAIIVAGGYGSTGGYSPSAPYGGGLTGANGAGFDAFGNGGTQTANGSGNGTSGYFMWGSAPYIITYSNHVGGYGGAGYFGGAGGRSRSTGGGGSGYVGGVANSFTQQGTPSAAPAGVTGTYKAQAIAAYQAGASKDYGMVIIYSV
jgi:hypothetical protein